MRSYLLGCNENEMIRHDMTDEMMRVTVRQIMLNDPTFALMAKFKFITYLNWFAAAKQTF